MSNGGLSPRDRGVNAAVVGFFASLWFTWGDVSPSPVAPVLKVGSVLSLVLLVVGVVMAVRYRRSGSVADDASARRRYGIIVGIEFGAAGVGAVLLARLGHQQYIPVLICAIVGLHFFPLAPVLRNRILVPLGALLTAVAAAALIVGLTTHVAPATVTGLGAGTLLLASGVYTVVRRPPHSLHSSSSF